jgi:two-component system chemotaxis sensor kinase CheA
MQPTQEEFMRQLLAIYATEAQEHLQVINQGLLTLEEQPGAASDEALLAAMFRAAHSLKGAARAVGAVTVSDLAHHLESVMGKIQAGRRQPNPAQFDLLYQTMDGLAALIGEATGGAAGGSGAAGGIDAAALADRLDSIDALATAPAPPAEAADSPLPPPAPPTPAPVAPPVTPLTPPAAGAPVARTGEPHLAGAEDSVRVAVGKLDAIMEQVSELQVVQLANALAMRRLRGLVNDLNRAAGAQRRWAPGGTQANDDADHALAALIGELQQLCGDLQANCRHEAQLVGDLETHVLRTRLMPLASILEPFPRMVRDLAHELGKTVRLTITGGETEVDRAVLEQIKSPLIHLLRNAVDHGIEAPAVRAALGKPAEGEIRLSAAARGSTILIEVKDDGAGIDGARVRAAAIQRGVIDAAEAGRLSEHDLLWLIFRSGMSTRAEVTNVSGRGVGLDVVRTQVERLRGYIDITSTSGRGACFALHLPLSVATTNCLLFERGGQLFAIPTSGVLRVTRVAATQIGRAEGRDVVRIGERVLALHDLADLLKLSPATAPVLSDGLVYALLLGVADQRVAIGVDAVHEVQELVIKPLPPPLSHVQHIAGASNLGTGDIALVLNISDLVRTASQGGVHSLVQPRPAPLPATVEAPASVQTILVADDSFTTRSLERNILETAGYRVCVAADGLEAWTLLQSEPVNLVVSDVMMPHMTGFDLTSRIRSDKRLADLPVVLVTAQESPEDRERGLSAGADAYLVKSAFDQDNLLEIIRRLI